VVHLSPLGSQLSFSNAANRIENIADWEAIANKFRVLIGEVTESQLADDGTTNLLSSEALPNNS
jgi:hypothetical protein